VNSCESAFYSIHPKESQSQIDGDSNYLDDIITYITCHMLIKFSKFVSKKGRTNMHY
jgi:hypothetical protein